MIVSAFNSCLPQYSMLALSAVIIFLAIYKIMLSCDKYRLQHYYKIITIACYFQLFWLLTQIFSVECLMHLSDNPHQFKGTTGSALILSAMLLFSLIPIYKYKKWLIIPPIIAILASRQSGAIFALIGGLLFYVMFTTQKCRKTIICMVIFLALVAFKIDNPLINRANGRFDYWEVIAKDIVAEKTFTGYGLGIFKHLQYEHWNTNVYRAHNVYLQITREQGLIGLFFMLLLPLSCFIDFLRHRTKEKLLWMTAIVMILLNMVGNFPDRNYTTMLLMLFIFACYRVNRRDYVSI